ncbi:hypothetical protein ACTMUQ_30875 [Streptomyces sp. SD11]|uniref:hypothetical protein n=1 Tax=Streptomyces sp. SD11 TaxID=3452209 RepID=UPI003F8A4517
MFVVPRQAGRLRERTQNQEQAQAPAYISPALHAVPMPESDNFRASNTGRHTAPARADIATVTTLIPSTGRLSVATRRRSLHASYPAQKTREFSLRGSHLRLGAFAHPA